MQGPLQPVFNMYDASVNGATCGISVDPLQSSFKYWPHQYRLFDLILIFTNIDD